MHKKERIVIYSLLFLCLLFNLWTYIEKNNFKQLTIKNSSGKPSITLSTGNKGLGKIAFYAPDGSVDTLIWGGGLTMNAPGEKEVIWLGRHTGNHAAGGLIISDSNEQKLVDIGSNSIGGDINLFSKIGYPLASISGFNASNEKMSLVKSAGGVQFCGFNGKKSVSCGITENGSGSFVLWDPNEEIYLKLP